MVGICQLERLRLLGAGGCPGHGVPAERASGAAVSCRFQRTLEDGDISKSWVPFGLLLGIWGFCLTYFWGPGTTK